MYKLNDLNFIVLNEDNNKTIQTKLVLLHLKINKFLIFTQNEYELIQNNIILRDFLIRYKINEQILMNDFLSQEELKLKDIINNLILNENKVFITYSVNEISKLFRIFAIFSAMFFDNETVLKSLQNSQNTKLTKWLEENNNLTLAYLSKSIKNTLSDCLQIDNNYSSTLLKEILKNNSLINDLLKYHFINENTKSRIFYEYFINELTQSPNNLNKII